MHGYNDKNLPNPCNHIRQDSSPVLSAGVGSSGVDVDADVQPDPGPDRLRPAAATSVSHPARPRPHRSHRQPRLPTHVQSEYRGTAPEHPSRLST
jgi:hypothetical protein